MAPDMSRTTKCNDGMMIPVILPEKMMSSEAMQQLEEEPGRYHDTRWLAEIQEAATTDEMSTAGLLLTPALMAIIVTVD